MASITMASTSRLRVESAIGTTSSGTTICLWVIPSALSTSTNLRMWLMSNKCVGSNTNTSGDIRVIDLGGTVFQTVTDSSTLTIGTPTFISLSISGSTVTLGVNGVNVDSDSVTTLVSDTGFHIGETTNALPGEYGSIRVFNRELSQVEINTIYTTQGRDGIVEDQVYRVDGTEVSQGDTISTNTLKNIMDTSDSLVVSNTIVGGNGLIPVGYRRRIA